LSPQPSKPGLKSRKVKALLLLAPPVWAYPSVWTLADCNGDHRPDVARLAVSRPALLLPIDLDHDLDLVLCEPLTDRPLAVWLNDGRGRFTRDASPRRLPTSPPCRTPLPLALPIPVPTLSRSLKSAAARGPPFLSQSHPST